MPDEIRVSVHRWGEGRNLMLRWTDPISGRRKTESAGTTNWRKAERLAGELEKKLRTGEMVTPSKVTWEKFRERYRDEKLATMPESSQVAYTVALDHVDRLLGPDRLAKLTTSAMSEFSARARKDGMGPGTLARHLRHIKASLRWAERQGLMAKTPHIDMPKHTAKMKGRPITTEEYERMLAAVPKVRPKDTPRWRRLLKGLWLSGLRIGEAMALDWQAGDFQIDLTGKHPAFRIQPEGQKSGRPEIAPIAPDFGEWLLQTPEADRIGPVFPIPVTKAGKQMIGSEAGRIVSDIGEKAGVLVDPETGKTASAHDLRRAFGTRWAQKVMPMVLKRLMRHRQISTTEKYYVGMDTDEVAEGLWQAHNGNTERSGNKSGNTRRKRRRKPKQKNDVSPDETK